MTTSPGHELRVTADLCQGLRTEVPLPTRLVSNEEFAPLPQTRAQQAVERRILVDAGRLAPRLGLSRRAFLRTSGGMATSLLAMNAVFGRFFDVLPVEAAEPSAFQERAGAPVRRTAIAIAAACGHCCRETDREPKRSTGSGRTPSAPHGTLRAPAIRRGTSLVLHHTLWGGPRDEQVAARPRRWLRCEEARRWMLQHGLNLPSALVAVGQLWNLPVEPARTSASGEQRDCGLTGRPAK